MRAYLFVLGLVAAGCNSIIEAGPPEIIDTTTGGGAGGDDDGGSLTPPEPLCGNGALDEGEECDDGNDAPSDGCDECRLTCGPVPEAENTATGACYLFETAQPEEWSDAMAACEAWGGTLAAVTSADELAFVQQHVESDMWIGGRDPAGAASFEWVTGEPWEFESFSTKPGASTHEGCVLIEGELLGFRRDECGVAAGYVCERALPPAE